MDHIYNLDRVKLLIIKDSIAETVSHTTSSILRFQSTFGELRPADLRMHAADQDAESDRSGTTRNRKEVPKETKKQKKNKAKSPVDADKPRTSKRQRKFVHTF
jgi:Asp-tRNA(Asn)/Glu-tRNA(Gln) amidotransferase C subunit